MLIDASKYRQDIESPIEPLTVFPVLFEYLVTEFSRGRKYQTYRSLILSQFSLV